MLYDVFICHASEDKEGFVRPLAEALQKEHVEVWYDEFSLKLGDSIRRSIDKGLRQSRFGIVVLSESFFKKEWTQYELDGLTELEMGRDKVILPVWHNVARRDVLRFSPSLAGRKATLSSNGLSRVVAEIINEIRPQGSPFIRARDLLIEWGIAPPVVTDEYWLDVVEASNRIPAYGAYVPEESAWDRWSFPLPENKGDPMSRGDRLAWTAMQLRWTTAAENQAITPLTHPEIVLKFIDAHPGLFETSSTFPRLTAEYAPQLTIPGFGGDLEPRFEEVFRESCAKTKSQTRICEVEWALRHPNLGGYEPREISHAYFSGGMFGPTVSPYDHSQHLMWLLSSASKWLPHRFIPCSWKAPRRRDFGRGKTALVLPIPKTSTLSLWRSTVH